MSTRKLVAIGSLVVLTGGALVVFATLDRRFNESCFDKIKEGMTEEEVVAILGCPAGDYRPRHYKKPSHFVAPDTPMAFPVKWSGLSPQELFDMQQEYFKNWLREGWKTPIKVSEKYWLGKTWGLAVGFDEKGLVIHHQLWEMVTPRPPGDVLGKLRWYTGL